MDRKVYIKGTLISGLIVLALGGWLLHLRVYPPLNEGYNLVPFIAGLISVVLVPLLFYFRSTFAYAFVLNGFMVILGTITMTHFSIVHFSGPLTLNSLLFNTLLPDIAILWGNFAFGRAIFDLELLNTAADPMPKGRYFRYPNNGWWLVHLFGWAVVYALGNILWK
ncbi:MAG: hypothetical protein WCW67_00070 [Candidatus Margulisiibacteriota bacterium]